MIKVSSAVVCFGVCLGVSLAVVPTSVEAGAIISVASGGDLQKAINAAAPGDTIQLEPGGRYVGNFVLPLKTGTGTVTIRTAPDSRQPGLGVRVRPSHAPALARLMSPNSDAALRTDAGAHDYRLMLLEFGPNSEGFGDIIQLGQADDTQTSLAQVPYSLVLDRLYIHGDPIIGQKRGIALNSASTNIVNCYISDIKAVGQDSQAIAAMNGPGPYLIENNYLEAAAENFMAGGVDPQIPNLIPSDITFRYNYLSKPVAWRNGIVPTPTQVAAVGGAGALPAGTYAYRVVAEQIVAQGATARSAASAEVSVTLAGTGGVTVSWAPVASAVGYRVYGRLPGSATQYWTTTSTSFVDNGAAGTAGTPGAATTWSIKNIFELKNARRVTIERNVMENIWRAAQAGYAIMFTPRNSGGTCTWCAVEDVTFRFNTIRHVGGGVNILGHDDGGRVSGLAQRITIVDNLFYDVNTAWGGDAWFVLMGGGPVDVVINHNTVDHNGTSMIYAYGSPMMTGTQVINNLLRHNNYGIFGSGSGVGNLTLVKYFVNPIVTSNVFAGGSASNYPAGNLFPTVASHVAQFTAPAQGDYSLVAGSSYASAGLDGKDLGANIAEVVASVTLAQGGVPPAALNAVQITTTNLPQVTVGTPLNVTLAATGGSGKYTWSLAGALPAGVQFNPATATLSGIPTQYGTWPIQVTAADAADPSTADIQPLTLTIAPTAVRITGASLPGQIMGRPATGAIYAADGTGSYSWRILSGTLPQGVVIDASAGTLSGTPTAAGTFAFTVQVSDATYADLTAQASFSITVAPPPVAVVTTALAGGVQGVPYAAVLEASGGASPLSWSAIAGTLPSGLTLSADGRISGTPAAAGSWTFDVKVIDSLYPTNTATAKLTIAVTAAVTSGDIVLYACRTTVLAGTWGVVSDATAAGGARVAQPDAGAPKVTTPLAAPANYFELSFTPEANRPYHLWIRGKAQNDYWGNDSVYVQFSGSLATDRTAAYRIGTTSALRVNLEDGLNVGESGWGWQDNGWGVNVLGEPIYFDGTTQRLRIQTREDGFSIDQIVLSPVPYFTASPGALKNDTTILAESPAVDLTEIVMRASSVSALAGTFHAIPDATAAEGTAIGTTDAGLAKIITPLAAPANYVELRFQAKANTAYRLWMRGRAQNDSWANDSAHVQFSNSLDAAGTPIYRIGTTSATTVNLEDALNIGVSGWGWQDNGWGVNVLGPLVYFATTGPQTIRVQVREDGYRFDQIVLSSEKYLTAAPGALKNDTTILK